MKRVFLLSLTALLLLTFSCKKDPIGPGPSGEIPDLVVNLEFKEGGTTLETISFDYETQQPGAGEIASAGGSYLESTDLFTAQVLGKPGSVGPTFAISGPIGGMNATTHQVKPLDSTNPLANLYATFVTEASEGFTTTSGTFKMSNVNLYQDTGIAAADYFMDVEVDMTLATADGSRTITVTGTMEGLNIKSQ